MAPIAKSFRKDAMSDAVWHQSLIQSIDKLTITQSHIPETVLVERAALGTVQSIPSCKISGAIAVILAGSGNNGSDALAVARLLREEHPELMGIRIFQKKSRKNGASKENVDQQKRVAKSGLTIESFDTDQISKLIATNQKILLVDGIFGIGYQHDQRNAEIESSLSKISDCVRKAKNAFVVAIDVPSGVACDTFDCPSWVIPADLTVTFGAKRPCHVAEPSRALCGQVVVVKVGFSDSAIQNSLKKFPPILHEIQSKKLLDHNPFDLLPSNAHKYDRGHVLIIGGSRGKIGAPILSARAAQRYGAGWVTLALPKEANLSEAPISCTQEDFFHDEKLRTDDLSKFLKDRRVKCVAIGMGMMASPFNRESLNVLFDFVKSGGKLVVDAGATQNWLDHEIEWPRRSVVLTPHAGEWAKLSANRLEVPHSLQELLELQKKYLSKSKARHCTFILKTAAPLIFDDSRPEIFVSTTGSIALSKAGSGDVLTGILAAHLGLDLNLENEFSERIHRSLAVLADAGDRAAKIRGVNGVIAEDLF